VSKGLVVLPPASPPLLSRGSPTTDSRRRTQREYEWKRRGEQKRKQKGKVKQEKKKQNTKQRGMMKRIVAGKHGATEPARVVGRRRNSKKKKGEGRRQEKKTKRQAVVTSHTHERDPGKNRNRREEKAAKLHSEMYSAV